VTDEKRRVPEMEKWSLSVTCEKWRDGKMEQGLEKRWIAVYL
jgi:hypothetical protein